MREIIDIALHSLSRLDRFARTRGFENVITINMYRNATDAFINSLPTQADKDVYTRRRIEAHYLHEMTQQIVQAIEIIIQDCADGKTPLVLTQEYIFSRLPELKWPVPLPETF